MLSIGMIVDLLLTTAYNFRHNKMAMNGEACGIINRRNILQQELTQQYMNNDKSKYW